MKMRGGNPVYSREETNEASIKRTHTYTKRAYMRPMNFCKI